MGKVYLKKAEKRKSEFLEGKNRLNPSVYLGIPIVKDF